MVPITTRPRYRVSEAVDIVAAAVIVTADKPASGRRNKLASRDQPQRGHPAFQTGTCGKGGRSPPHHVG
jgi:hypothetical protein